MKISGETPEVEPIFMFVDERLRSLFSDHNIYFSDWLDEKKRDPILEYLRIQGYKAYTPANPFGKGNIQTWLKNVDNGMIGNESIDHYSKSIRASYPEKHPITIDKSSWRCGYCGKNWE